MAFFAKCNWDGKKENKYFCGLSKVRTEVAIAFISLFNAYFWSDKSTKFIKLFLKNKIKPIVEQINGNKEKWNAVCIHLKSQYSKPEYRFIIEAFDSLGMKVYS